MFNDNAALIRPGSFHFISFCLLCLLQVLLPQYLLADFEKPGVLKAQSVLEPQFLKGENYTVDGDVQNDGILNHYSVKSSFGDFKAPDTSSLRTLVGEINAIAAMKKIETDDTAIESLKGVDNRELYIKVALQASDPEMARIVTESVVLTAGYHKNIAPLNIFLPWLMTK